MIVVWIDEYILVCWIRTDVFVELVAGVCVVDNLSALPPGNVL
jgi:hypothetical protein